jgi:hypothetical protein
MPAGGQAPDNGAGKARFVLVCPIRIPLPTQRMSPALLAQVQPQRVAENSLVIRNCMMEPICYKAGG